MTEPQTNGHVEPSFGDLRVFSELTNRLAFAYEHGFQYGGDRDLYKALGYSRTISLEAMRQRWQRDGIARRIVNAKPAATWREAPEVFEAENPKTLTRWERQWATLLDTVPVFSALERLDTLAGIGRYGVLLLGLRDGRELEREVGSLRNGPQGVLYLQPYANDCATIERVVEDSRDPRFGKPLLYKLKLGTQVTGKAARTATMPVLVHWTRILHFADDAYEDESYGTPRLEPVWNLLDDLMKVVGGCGEMFWRAGYPGLHANVTKDGRLPQADIDSLDERLKLYEHGLRRLIQTQHVDLQAISSQLADPRGAFEVITSVIAGTTGIPKRILLGSERGELASGQDERNWKERIFERQRNVAEPRALRPFLERMELVGALPAPRKPLSIEWPDLLAPSDAERAERVFKLTQAENQHSSAVRSGRPFLAESEIREALEYSPDMPLPAAPPVQDEPVDEREAEAA